MVASSVLTTAGSSSRLPLADPGSCQPPDPGHWGEDSEKGVGTGPGKVRGLPPPSQGKPCPEGAHRESPSRSSRLISQLASAPSFIMGLERGSGDLAGSKDGRVSGPADRQTGKRTVS